MGWLGILSCLIIGDLYFNKENRITNYFKKDYRSLLNELQNRATGRENFLFS